MVNHDEAQTVFLGLILLAVVVAIILIQGWFEYQKSKDVKRFSQQEEVVKKAMEKIEAVTRDVSVMKNLLDPFNQIKQK